MQAIGEAVNEQMSLLTGDGEQGIGWVPIEEIAWGTYGSVVGLNPDGETVADSGYIIYSHPLPGGLGGAGVDRVAVYLAPLPSFSVANADVLYVYPATVVTVLEPPIGMPDGESAPWRRMPIEDQITAAAEAVGIEVQVIPSDPNPLYQLNDDDPTALSRVADYLLDGGHRGSLGRARAIPHPHRVRDARRQP